MSQQALETSEMLLEDLWRINRGQVGQTVFYSDWTYKYENIQEDLVNLERNGYIVTWAKNDGSISFRFTPKARDQLNRQRRQITIDAKHLDLRNGATYEVLAATPEALNIVAESYLNNIKTSSVKKVKRACQRELHRMILLRSSDLTPEILEEARFTLTGILRTLWQQLPELTNLEEIAL